MKKTLKDYRKRKVIKVSVNSLTLELFEGAKVRNALQRYLAQGKMAPATIDKMEVQDFYGHEMDHDAPLHDGQIINVII